MEMKLLFAESKLEEIEALKMQIKNVERVNQQLRDEVSLVIPIFLYCYL